jgi:L-fuconate dehydratase
MFKQFLQAEGLQYCQIDSCRLGGVNEILSVILMAAKFGGFFKIYFSNTGINK